MSVIAFEVPLPPKALRGNTGMRSHWMLRKRAADAYSEAVHAAFLAARPHPVHDAPWQRARVTYTWRHASVAPDHGNLGGNTKYLQDILCCAPKLSPAQAQRYTRWHLGIVEDDAGITAEYRLEKVRSRKDECVVITVERWEAE